MSTQDSRIKIKRSTVTGTVPTVAPSTDHTQPSPAWSATDIYKGELFINQADNVVWSRGDDGVFCIGGNVKKVLTKAELLALNTTPITVVPAVSGYAIEVISASVRNQSRFIPYATNLNLQLLTDTATDAQFDNAKILLTTVSAFWKMSAVQATSATDTQLIANKALTATIETGDPTSGGDEVELHVNYRLIPA
jgi:hypothetical protein